jgi:hypothetical protein
MVLVAAFNAFRQLPRAPASDAQARTPQGYLPLLARAELLWMYCCAAVSPGVRRFGKRSLSIGEHLQKPHNAGLRP